MGVLTNSLTQHLGEAFLFLTLLLVIVAGTAISTARRLQTLQKKWDRLLKGSSTENLEELLLQHLEERAGLTAQSRRHGERISQLEALAKTAKRHVGLIRYDAFEDVSGKQSFALAVFDSEGNGAVLTSVVGRMDCRVYAKPLVNMQSERMLSQEERRAIAEAREDGPRSIVSE